MTDTYETTATVPMEAAPMSTLKVGIADPEEMKARTQRIARGEERASPGDPTAWFVSTESFAKLLSAPNRDMLRVITQEKPDSRSGGRME